MIWRVIKEKILISGIPIWTGICPDRHSEGFCKINKRFSVSVVLIARKNLKLPNMKSADFWDKMNFEPVKYDMARDKGENPYIWHPDTVK
jgi:hypothetical protein